MEKSPLTSHLCLNKDTNNFWGLLSGMCTKLIMNSPDGFIKTISKDKKDPRKVVESNHGSNLSTNKLRAEFST